MGQETRQRVLDAIAETGYTPDSVARSLRGRRSEAIGLVLPDIRNPFFANVIDGVETEARAQKQTLLFVNSAEDPELEVDALRQLRSRRVDGLIVGLTRNMPQQALDGLRAARVPVVLVDRAGPPEFDQVLVANDVATMVLVDHLLEAGHQRIAMIAGVRGISTAEDRIAGFVGALERAGLAVGESVIIDGGSRRELARAAVTDALSSGRRFDALVVGNNEMTLGTLEAISLLGLRVPDDIAVVSVDDLPTGDLLASPLTAVVQPSFAIGREAMRLLLRRIQSPEASAQHVRLRAGFVHRRSCGCSARLAHALGRAEAVDADEAKGLEST